MDVGCKRLWRSLPPSGGQLDPFASSVACINGRCLKAVRSQSSKALNRLLTRDRLVPKIALAKMSFKGFVREFAPKSNIGVQELQLSQERLVRLLKGS